MAENQKKDAAVWEAIEKSEQPSNTDTREVYERAWSEQEADGRQKRHLRYCVAGGVGILLLFELIALITIILFQGFKLIDLNQWVFGFFVNGVIIQTFASLHIIVTHLFPDGKIAKK
jgi:hypothetical protein